VLRLRLQLVQALLKITRQHSCHENKAETKSTWIALLEQLLRINNSSKRCRMTSAKQARASRRIADRVGSTSLELALAA
jgi:hypothetical protein